MKTLFLNIFQTYSNAFPKYSIRTTSMKYIKLRYQKLLAIETHVTPTLDLISISFG